MIDRLESIARKAQGGQAPLVGNPPKDSEALTRRFLVAVARQSRATREG